MEKALYLKVMELVEMGCTIQFIFYPNDNSVVIIETHTTQGKLFSMMRVYGFDEQYKCLSFIECKAIRIDKKY
jgi:hypothetical protein